MGKDFGILFILTFWRGSGMTELSLSTRGRESKRDKRYLALGCYLVVSAILGAAGSLIGGGFYAPSLVLFFPWTLVYVLVGVFYVIIYGSVVASDTTVAVIASVLVLILGTYLLLTGAWLRRWTSRGKTTPAAQT